MPAQITDLRSAALSRRLNCRLAYLRARVSRRGGFTHACEFKLASSSSPASREAGIQLCRAEDARTCVRQSLHQNWISRSGLPQPAHTQVRGFVRERRDSFFFVFFYLWRFPMLFSGTSRTTRESSDNVSVERESAICQVQTNVIAQKNWRSDKTSFFFEKFHLT